MTSWVRGLLLGRTRVWMIAVAFLAALIVAGSNLIDEGEVVEVKTYDALGREYVTEVWIVDLDAASYLRAGSSDAAWLQRLQADPEIVLVRRGEESRHRAVPEDDDDTRRLVNAAMADKYGRADRIWARLSDLGRTIPIRLAPPESPPARVAP